MGVVRITQLDGALPNLALMKLSHWHKTQGDRVLFSRSPTRDLFEPAQYDRVYGSAIFAFSSDRIERFRREFPDAVVGGTGTLTATTVEDVLGIPADYPGLDYDMYPAYRASLGFTQRGCRLSCKFCVVPWKEGKPRSVHSIADIWRGEGWPRHLHLLDNDFFGQDEWHQRMAEIREGGFKVCFNQGINVRAMTPEVAASLATVEYRDDAFKRRRLYTAWDNLKDEGVFFRGIDMLDAAGVPPNHVMAYMLVGFAKAETFEKIQYRFSRMVDRGVLPYPMVFDCRATDPARYRRLKKFQRWAVTGLYRAVPFSEYDASRKRRDDDKSTRNIFAAE